MHDMKKQCVQQHTRDKPVNILQRNKSDIKYLMRLSVGGTSTRILIIILIMI